MLKIVILPGLDGGETLLSGMATELEARTSFTVEVLTYPVKRLGYDALEVWLRANLPQDPPYLLVAESFSGPLGIRLAASPPAGLRGLVLVATFARPPVWGSLAPIVRPVLFRMPPPGWAIRRFMVGADADDSLVEAIQQAIALNPAEVLAYRVRETLRVDVRELASAIALPVFCLTPSNDRLVRRPLKPEASWAGETVSGPHLLLQRYPAICATKIAEFIEELDVADGFE